MASNNSYNQKFFSDLQNSAKSSAGQVVPVILELINCKSVVDVGCGTGEWLSVFKDLNVPEVLGFDGDYVDRSMLKIPLENFRSADLTRPLEVEKKFDLAISLEVGEHLPEDNSDVFVKTLTDCAPVVLFSASIPHQEGICHINEQWNDYWIEKFRDQGYIAIDFLREKFWQNESVAWWYKQNMLVFVRKERLLDYPKLSALCEGRGTPPRLVHPEIFIYHVRKNAEKDVILNRRIVRLAIRVDQSLRYVAKRILRKNG